MSSCSLNCLEVRVALDKTIALRLAKGNNVLIILFGWPMDAAQLIRREQFHDISLDDPFFDSLKADYPAFQKWFLTKAADSKNFAFTFRNQFTHKLDGFLYLKEELGEILDVTPPLAAARRLKLGTFKVNPHGTRLGERFMKRAFDTAVALQVQAVYVTVFPKHSALVELFRRYGFVQVARKEGATGEEMVLERRLDAVVGDVVLDYPRIPIQSRRHFVLSLYPKWHSRLLPDSLLKTETSNILEDVSHSNSIHKIYLAAMNGVEDLRRGDTLLIYRTADGGPAYYTSVITSIGVVEELLNIQDFSTWDEFFANCRPYSVFTIDELKAFYATKKFPWIIKFTYNVALTKRVNRKTLMQECGISADYWGFFQITTEQLKKVVTLSHDYEKMRSLIYSS